MVRRDRRRCRIAGRSTGRKKARTTRELGRILRAGIEIPNGQSAVQSHRTSKSFSMVCPSRSIWSSISRIASCTGPTAATRRAATRSTAPPWTRIPGQRPAPDIVLTHLMEGIGIALDLKGGRMFLTDLAGSVYSANLDGSEKQTLLYAQGNLTGIAYVELPPTEK